MKTSIHAIISIALLGSVLPFTFAANGQGESRRRGFEAFHLVQTRNIFDPNRRAPRNEESRRSENRNRPDAFTLTGTMVTATKTLAFFNGSRSDYSRVIPVGQNVGPFKLKTISTSQVELERDGKPITLPIGRTLQIEGSSNGGAPEIVDGPSQPPPPESPGPASTSTASAPGVPGAPTVTVPAAGASGSTPPSNDPAEIRRRMMERRQQEMSK
jgi:hypothetical protein